MRGNITGRNSKIGKGRGASVGGVAGLDCGSILHIQKEICWLSIGGGASCGGGGGLGNLSGRAGRLRLILSTGLGPEVGEGMGLEDTGRSDVGGSTDGLLCVLGPAGGLLGPPAPPFIRVSGR